MAAVVSPVGSASKPTGNTANGSFFADPSHAIFKLLTKRIEENTRLRRECQSPVGSGGRDGVRKSEISLGQLKQASIAGSMADRPAGRQ